MWHLVLGLGLAPKVVQWVLIVDSDSIRMACLNGSGELFVQSALASTDSKSFLNRTGFPAFPCRILYHEHRSFPFSWTVALFIYEWHEVGVALISSSCEECCSYIYGHEENIHSDLFSGAEKSGRKQKTRLWKWISCLFEELANQSWTGLCYCCRRELKANFMSQEHACSWFIFRAKGEKAQDTNGPKSYVPRHFQQNPHKLSQYFIKMMLRTLKNLTHFDATNMMPWNFLRSLWKYST